MDELSHGERAARNTVVRAVGEITGKFASLILFAAMARSLGQAEVGVFVFALAFGQIAVLPTGLGLDRWLLRHVAADRSRAGRLADVLALKAVVSIPVLALAAVVILVIGEDARTREAVMLIVPGLVLEALMRSHFALFNAYERGDLLSTCLVVQRWSAAGLGLAALAAGLGVVSVAAAYSAGALIGLALARVMLRRHLGPPRAEVAPSGWVRLTGRTAPFAVQDLLGVGLARADAVMLSLIASQAAVGRYGAAYRLLEATFFLASSVNGAFAAMFTYLTPTSDPPVGAVFQRALKLLLAALVPCAVALGLLADPIVRLVFGDDFAAAAEPLRLLAPVVVLSGVVYLATSLNVSRGSPRAMVMVAAAMLVLNLGLNAVLIPAWDEEGAATAMLAATAGGAVAALALAHRRAPGVSWRAAFLSPLAAGAAMAAACVALEDVPLLALGAGALVYGAVLAGLERWLHRADYDFVTGLVGRRLGRA